MLTNVDGNCWEALLRHAGDVVAALLGGWTVGYTLRGRCSLLLTAGGENSETPTQ